jgi:hypothetical protein
MTVTPPSDNEDAPTLTLPLGDCVVTNEKLLPSPNMEQAVGEEALERQALLVRPRDSKPLK